MLFNALEESCKQLDIADRYFDSLACVFAVFGEPDLRRTFQNDCCQTPQGRSLFDVAARHHVDWRWEFLGPALDWVIDHWRVMSSCWDIKKMEYSEAGELKRASFREVTSVWQWPLFELLSEMFKAAGQLLELWAGMLEGCECHRRIFTVGKATHRPGFARVIEVALKVGLCR